MGPEAGAAGPAEDLILTRLPPEGSGTQTGLYPQSLPSEEVAQSVRRVRAAALVIGVVWALTGISNLLLAGSTSYEAFPGTGGWPWPNTGFAAIAVAGSLGVALAASRLRNRPGLVLDLGLGFEVFTAALIALVSFWVPAPHAARISWTCPLIVLYPAIAPSPSRKMLVASFAAASMDALGLGLARVRGVASDLPLGQMAWMLAPNFLCVALAMVPATLIRRLGRQVTAARELGSYRLGRLLGKGGMGNVYQARHRMIARPAAIKLIRPELLANSPHLASALTERFHREAEAVAALRSPHTVQLYDFGVAPDGTLFYAMELLDGIDLQRLVEDFGPVPPARAIHILRQACDSLAEAHARGLIHRDVKPSNLLLCRLGLSLDFTKVLDFGLVRREVQTDGEERLTGALAAPGTPAFMAPEAARGLAVDRRADVYALACVGFWLVTGRMVFEGDSPVQVMYRHAYDPPPRPSEVAGHPLPADLERVLLAALAKSPEQRTPSAEEFARQLEECADAGKWTREKARGWWRQRARGPGDEDEGESKRGRDREGPTLA